LVPARSLASKKKRGRVWQKDDVTQWLEKTTRSRCIITTRSRELSFFFCFFFEAKLGHAVTCIIAPLPAKKNKVTFLFLFFLSIEKSARSPSKSSLAAFFRAPFPRFQRCSFAFKENGARFLFTVPEFREQKIKL
jgi:hypothetical protein